MHRSNSAAESINSNQRRLQPLLPPRQQPAGLHPLQHAGLGAASQRQLSSMTVVQRSELPDSNVMSGLTDRLFKRRLDGLHQVRGVRFDGGIKAFDDLAVAVN